MKREMTLMELQDIFGSRIRVALREDLTPEQRKEENEQTNLILEAGRQMINNADIVMRHETLLAKCKDLKESRMNDLIGE